MDYLEYENGTVSDVSADDYSIDKIISVYYDGFLTIHGFVYDIDDRMVYSYPWDKNRRLYIGDIIVIPVSNLDYEPYNHDDDEPFITVLNTGYRYYPTSEMMDY